MEKKEEKKKNKENKKNKPKKGTVKEKCVGCDSQGNLRNGF